MILLYLLAALGMGFCGLFFWTLWTAEDGPSILPGVAVQDFAHPGSEGSSEDPLFEN